MFDLDIKMNSNSGGALESAREVIVLGIYQHYKGNLYQVLGTVRHSENLEKLVLYQALYGDYGLWVRPLEMFLEMVEVNNTTVPRFCLIQRLDGLIALESDLK